MSATVQIDGIASPRPAANGLPPLRSLARLLDRALLVLAAVVLAAAAGLALYARSFDGRIYEGVSVAGIPLGGMTEAEAEKAISHAWATWASTPVEIETPEGSRAVRPAEAGLDWDRDATLGAAMGFGRSGSTLADSRSWARGLARGVDLPVAIAVDGGKARSALAALAPGIVQAPIDARMAFDSERGATLEPDVPGVVIDAAATVEELAALASRLDAAPVSLAVEEIPPRVTARSLSPALPAARSAIGRPLVLSAGDQAWHLPAGALSGVVSVDPGTAALVADRGALTSMLVGIADGFGVPATNAAIAVDDTGRLAVTPSQPGVGLDIAASVDAIEAALATGSSEVALATRPVPALIDDATAAAAALETDAKLDAGMTLSWDGGSAHLGRGDLLRALTIKSDPRKPEPFSFGFDPEVLGGSLQEVAAGFDTSTANARFRLQDGQIVVAAPERTGRTIDVERGVKDISAAFTAARPEVRLQVKAVEPEWTAADLAAIALGNDILGEGGTWYGDSSEPRRNNVEVAAMLQSGWLIPPGGEFSYAENIGPVDESQGFQTGFGIMQQGEEFVTSPVIGGGICQVSTTIYQAAFWAGLPFTERYQHPYYLRVYGEGPTGLPGLDAMVNIDPVWTLDMKFRNTTGEWIAVLLIPDGQNLWVRIIGTDPGWDVSVSEPVITNRVTADPEMHYLDSPELPAGQEMVVEAASDGFDVSIERTVVRSGEVIDSSTVTSSFTPSRNLTLRGAGEPAA